MIRPTLALVLVVLVPVQSTIPLRFPLNWFRTRPLNGTSSTGNDAAIGLGGASQLLAAVAQNPHKAAQDLEAVSAMQAPALELRNKTDGSGEVVIVDEANLQSGTQHVKGGVRVSPPTEAPPTPPQGLSAFLSFFRPWLFGASTTTPQPSTVPQTMVQTSTVKLYMAHTTATAPETGIVTSTTNSIYSTPSPLPTTTWYTSAETQPVNVTIASPLGSTATDSSSPAPLTSNLPTMTESELEEKTAHISTVTRVETLGTNGNGTTGSGTLPAHTSLVEAEATESTSVPTITTVITVEPRVPSEGLESLTQPAQTTFSDPRPTASTTEEPQVQPRTFTFSALSTTTASSTTVRAASTATEGVPDRRLHTSTFSPSMFSSMLTAESSSAAPETVTGTTVSARVSLVTEAPETSSVTSTTLQALTATASSSSGSPTTSVTLDTTSAVASSTDTTARAVEATVSDPSHFTGVVDLHRTLDGATSTQSSGSTVSLFATATPTTPSNSTRTSPVALGVTTLATSPHFATSTPTPSTVVVSTAAQEAQSSSSPVYQYFFDPSQLMQESP